MEIKPAMENKSGKYLLGLDSRPVQELRESYSSAIWHPLVRRLLPIFRLINHAWKVLGLWRLPYRSVWFWLASVILLLTGLGFAYVILALMIVNADISIVAFAWDTYVLTAYDWLRLHQTWWLAVGIVMFCVWLLIRPLSSHRIGARRVRLTWLILSYGPLTTVSVMLAWMFQSELSIVEWWLALAVFVFCHFLFIFSFAVMTSITTKIPSVNLAYLKTTEQVLIDKPRPLSYVFEGSLYGFIIREGVGVFLDKFVGSWMGDTRGYRWLHRVLVGIGYLLSFAWLIDKIFGKPRFVQHFNMLLEWRAQNARSDAFQDLQGETIVPALERSARRFDIEYVPFEGDVE